MYNLRKTSSSKIYGINRVMLGIMFMMTGFMKLALPDYGHAWSIQLHEAGFPFYELISGVFHNGIHHWHHHLTGLLCPDRCPVGDPHHAGGRVCPPDSN